MECVVTPIKPSMLAYSRKDQTSPALIQLFSSNGTMLPTLTWAPLTSHQRVRGKFGGCVTSVPMAICTAGKRLLPTGAMAQVALSAVAAKCASTTAWQPRTPSLQLSGTMKQMVVHLTAWWHTALSLLLGSVMFVATSEVHHPAGGLTNRGVAAQSAVIVQSPGGGSSTQPLQTPSTLKQELAWHSGITNATHLRATSLTTPVCKAPSEFSGSAVIARQGSPTAGLHGLVSE